jgi:hypothetical protein
MRVHGKFPEEEHRAWGFSIQVPGGGVYEIIKALEFQAPTDAGKYQPEFAREFIPGTNDFQLGYEGKIFVRFSDGTYGLLDFRFIPWGNFGIVFKSYYEPTGSPNLDFDPKQQLNR